VEYCFEWNREKARTNRARHGVTFEEAATVFQDPQMVSVYNGEHSDLEDRWATLGISALGRLLVVCHTFRETSGGSATIRIISSRKATRHEARQHNKR
jgi:uncharacterized protein